MTGSDVWAVVPVKPFGLAKQRLAGVLDGAQRGALARVMLEDVLSAVAACRARLAGAIVVTADHDAASLARRHEASVHMESAAVGLNAALAGVVGCLSGRAAGGILVVPADLPQVSAADIEAMVDLIDRAPAIALVRARDGGTNLLACRPSSVITPSFGPDSFDAHCAAAASKGITPTIYDAPHLGLDIDRREDLEAFAEGESTTRTHAYLSRLRSLERRPTPPAHDGLVRGEP